MSADESRKLFNVMHNAIRVLCEGIEAAVRAVVDTIGGAHNYTGFPCRAVLNSKARNRPEKRDEVRQLKTKLMSEEIETFGKKLNLEDVRLPLSGLNTQSLIPMPAWGKIATHSEPL